MAIYQTTTVAGRDAELHDGVASSGEPVLHVFLPEFRPGSAEKIGTFYLDKARRKIMRWEAAGPDWEATLRAMAERHNEGEA